MQKQTINSALMVLIMAIACPMMSGSIQQQPLLVSAVISGEFKQVEDLISSNPSMNLEAVDKYGKTALIYAAENNFLEMARLLIRAGARLDEPANLEEIGKMAYRGKKEIHWPSFHERLSEAYGNKPEYAQYTGEDWVNFSRRLRDTYFRVGITPLMVAAMKNHSQMIRLLTRSGALLDSKDAYGFTALACAVDCSKLQSAQALIRAGSDVYQVNQFGKTLLDKAIDCNNPEMIALLTDAMMKGENAELVQRELNISYSTLFAKPISRFLSPARISFPSETEFREREFEAMRAHRPTTERLQIIDDLRNDLRIRRKVICDVVVNTKASREGI